MTRTAAVAPRAGDQVYRERLPTAEAADLVSSVWVQQIAPSAPVYRHREAPHGGVDISYAMGTAAVRVTGPRTGPTVQPLAPGATIVGLRLRPGAAPTLGWPGSALIGLEIPLTERSGRTSKSLGKALKAASSADEAAALLEQAMVERAQAADGPDRLVAAASDSLQPWRGDAVSDVARELCVSPRQLRRRFVEALGYGPKTLQRLLRFQAFLALSHAQGPGSALVDLAAATGYADQAHLSRECLRLGGLTPRVFLEAMHASCDGRHDHSASFAAIAAAMAARVGGGVTHSAVPVAAHHHSVHGSFGEGSPLDWRDPGLDRD